MRVATVRATMQSAEAQARSHCDLLGLDFMQLRTRLGVVIGEPATLSARERDLYGRPLWLLPAAVGAWQQMCEAARRDGVELLVVSGFRSMDYQAALWRRKLSAGQRLDAILAVSAPPGFSEHHSGRALDLHARAYRVLERDFERSPAFAWLHAHAARFQFRLSYPEGNASGYVYEPWHWYWYGAAGRTRARAS